MIVNYDQLVDSNYIGNTECYKTNGVKSVNGLVVGDEIEVRKTNPFFYWPLFSFSIWRVVDLYSDGLVCITNGKKHKLL